MEFLSCLCGSELPGAAALTPVVFLSCLCGSEPKGFCKLMDWDFLSCLCGSERWHRLSSV